MMTRIFAILATVLLMARAAVAQDITYIQIEAQPSLSRAEQRVRDYATVLRDVNGFSLGAGWYGIALGPYDRDQAEALLSQLRSEGRIPRDAYVAEPSEYQSQFWPVGASLVAPQVQPAPVAPAPQPDPVQAPEPTAPTVAQAQVAPAPASDPVVPDETPREARASEARLDRSEREALQIALKWAGVYTAGIDGAFGRGTRAAMQAWQEQNGFEPTGILTTLQRAELLRQYNAVLDGMDLRRVTESRAGIEMVLPMGAVAFSKYEAPFVHYDPTGTVDRAKVLLISQPGDRNTLFGLYEILQTLEIVPLEGPRERTSRGFTLEGRNDRIVSYTEARLEGDTIKGFTLIWPAGDEERRSRILTEMRSSFTPLNGVLDPGAISEGGQTVDLVSGLRVRTPKVSRSGFYVDRSGTVVTTTEAVQGCSRITLDDTWEARVLSSDAATGVAVLRPATTLAPISVAALQSGTPRIQSEVAVAGFSYGGALTAPTLTFGTLADLRGLGGEETLKRLAIAALPGDAGGPVFDGGGAVVGMLLPRDETGGRVLPADVSFAANAEAIRSALRAAGVNGTNTDSIGAMAPEDLTNLAAGMTVLVSCWE